MDILVLLWLAIGPGVALAVFIYYSDKWEPEPKAMVLKCFGFGALACLPVLIYGPTVIAAFGLQEVSQNPSNSSLLQIALYSFIGVALVEEFCKFLFLKGFIYDDREFNEPFDGIVYGGIIGCGFATLENIIYVLQSGVSVGMIRMFTAVPFHAFLGIILGYHLGKAKFGPEPDKQIVHGMLWVIVLHGAYDTGAFYKHPVWSYVIVFSVLCLGMYLGLKAKKELIRHSEVLEFSTKEFFLIRNRKKVAKLTLRNIRDDLGDGKLKLNDKLLAKEGGKLRIVKEVLYGEIGEENKDLVKIPGNGQSVKKFVAIYGLTFGLYIYLWFFRNYREFKNYKNLELNPELRALNLFMFTVIPVFIYGAFLGQLKIETLGPDFELVFCAVLAAVEVGFLFIQFQMFKKYMKENLKNSFSPFLIILALFFIFGFSNLIPQNSMGNFWMLIGVIFLQGGVLAIVQRDLNLFWEEENRKFIEAI